MKPRRLLLLGLLVSSAISQLAVVIAFPVKAQITVDGTTNTTVTPIDNGIRIDEGNRTGDNLFHSFQEFSVVNGSEAFFDNANDIVNIFSRVTGGNISNIDGLIRANGQANLFLINPAGIIFGENASLNIGGSFFASTAESIIFSDEIEFSATDTANEPLLTINQPLGLNIGNNPGDITFNSSNLQVNKVKTLALFGGNVSITGGQIIAPGANIELGGLTEAGQISFEQLEAISFPEGIARGDVALTNGGEVNVQAAGGGSIGINARNLELSGASNLRAGIAAGSGSTEAVAGDIAIDATDNITLSQGSLIANQVEKSAVGNAAGIKIATNNLSLTQGSQINTSTFGQGDAGAITIKALKNISIDGVNQDGFSSDVENIIPRSGIISIDGEIEAGFSSGIFSQVRRGAIGNSGQIDLTTANLSLTGGGRVDASTLGQGDGGAITIDVAETISADGDNQDGIIPSGIFSLVLDTAIGNSGEIDITTTNLSLTQGGQVSATTFGVGDAGAITIDAAETISADGESQDGLPSGILSVVLNAATGNSGEIDITTTNLSLTQGGVVSTNTFGVGDAGAITIDAAGTISADGESQSRIPSSILSLVLDTAIGNSGEIDITTANLSLTRGGAVSATTIGQGDAGAVTINASGTISADGESRDGLPSGILSVVSETGVGDSGGINITTTNLFLTQGSRVNASTFGQGNAGAIKINASETISADGQDRSGFGSGIFSTVAESGKGNAGGININTNSLSLTNKSEISVQSLGQGNAGNLNLQANSLSLESGAALFASTPIGTGGNITLQIARELILRDNSTISAQATENANGGNLTIDTNFIVAFPNGNNDIIASAEQGQGGNINITASALFGIEERLLNPFTNDINASSQFGLNGTITINELNVNPAQGLEELSAEVIDVTRLIAQSLCQQGDMSEFIVTGKGGIAPSPNQPREWEVSEVDLVEPASSRAEKVGEARKARKAEKAGEKIVEARGWIINDRGIVELVAHQTDLNGSSPQPTNDQICNGRLES